MRLEPPLAGIIPIELSSKPDEVLAQFDFVESEHYALTSVTNRVDNVFATLRVYPPQAQNHEIAKLLCQNPLPMQFGE